MTAKAKKAKSAAPRCPCGDGQIVEPWPCCDHCRRTHFWWPLPIEASEVRGAVVPLRNVLENMTSMRHPKIEGRVRLEGRDGRGSRTGIGLKLTFAWRRIERLRWTLLGHADEISYATFPDGVDTSAFHWWSQTLAAVYEELGAFDDEEEEGEPC